MTRHALPVDVAPRGVQARRAAAAIVAVLEEAIDQRGRAALALSGGASIVPLFDALADLAVRWPEVELFQVDERVAPDGHPDRNVELIRGRLVAPLGDTVPHLHPMPVTSGNLPDATSGYARTLAEVAGDPPVLDVVQLGLGADGHTASLLPAEVTGRDDTSPSVVLTGPYEGHRRMTLSLPVLSAARRIVWFVHGSEKAPAVRRLVDGDATIPAGAVARSQATLFLDPAAAADL